MSLRVLSILPVAGGRLVWSGAVRRGSMMWWRTCPESYRTTYAALTHSCRVPACLEWCREAGVDDAEAYLQEHFLGDYTAALQICLACVDRCVVPDTRRHSAYLETCFMPKSRRCLACVERYVTGAIRRCLILRTV